MVTVVTVANGGMPVTEVAATLGGLLIEEAATGIPVTVVASGGLPVVRVGGSLTTVAWNPADKAAAIDLSAADLTATRSGSGGQAVVRSLNPKTTGRWAGAIKVGPSPSLSRFGLANSSHVLTAALGLGTNSIAMSGGNGNILYNNVAVGDGPTPVENDIILVDYDFATSTVAFSLNGVLIYSGVDFVTASVMLAFGATGTPAAGTLTTGFVLPSGASRWT